MLEKQYVTRSEWKKHTQAHPLQAHGIWPRLKKFVPGWGYSQSEINAMWEGYSGSGKGQVHWNNVTNKPSSFPPSAHASSHQADGSDPLNNLLLGAYPYIKWQSGELLLQTDEGTDTTTKVLIKGKGTGFGDLRIYDEDDAECVRIRSYSGVGEIETYGTSPGTLHLQRYSNADVRLFASTSGNPIFYVRGYQTGVGVKYGGHWVDTSGHYNISGQERLVLKCGGQIRLHLQTDRLRIPDDIPLVYGGSSDFGQGYHSATGTYQIVQGAVLNSNIRAKLDSSARWIFYDKIGVGKTPGVELDIAGIIRSEVTPPNDTLYFKNLTTNDFWTYRLDSSNNLIFKVYDYSESLTRTHFVFHPDTGDIDCEQDFNLSAGKKLYIGSYYLDTLVADNRVYDSARWNGHLITETPLPFKLDDLAEPDDNIDLNVSINRHGLFPKLSNHPAQCLSGTGAWMTLYDSTSIIIGILSKVSTTVRNSNDTARYTNQSTYTKVKEVKLGEPTGAMSIYFELISNGPYPSYPTKALIYKNGSPISGYEHEHYGDSWGSYSENIGACDAQDLIQIYAKQTGNTTAGVRYMRFRYDRSINILGECTLATPITITTQTPFVMQNQDP